MMTDLTKNMLKSISEARNSNSELYVDDQNRMIPDNQSPPKDEISNNGRAHTQNVACIEHRGLLHRSVSECTMTEALARSNLLFAALPVLVEGSSRVEPDHLIFHNGQVAFIELDGPTHLLIPPEKEEARVFRIKKEGFKVFRFQLPPVNEVTVEWAQERIQEVINYLGRAA